MGDVPLPADLPAYLSDLERRVRTLETAPRLANSAFPWTAAADLTTFNTSSLTPVDSSPAGPTVTLNVTQTCRVLVTATAYIGLNSTSQSGFVWLYVDGVQLINILGTSNSASAFASNVSSSRVVDLSVYPGLIAGNHTFTLKYAVSTGNVNFSGRSIVVQTF